MDKNTVIETTHRAGAMVEAARDLLVSDPSVYDIYRAHLLCADAVDKIGAVWQALDENI